MNIWLMDSVSIGIRILLDIAKINKIYQNVVTFFVITSHKNYSLSITHITQYLVSGYLDTWISQLFWIVG